ncbi:Flp pilus assembly complex ATPase component TadA (plasmid) [Ureibacillus chungkukjangi]|uniref:ATPase, T2SS/T4P/T4SS family n=1 Tax=Ureibacillus chungkukjangi TaxID=1202712 RepID=UPI002006F129|nr:ATPase, T2SS/T4P/T4SS family [Ureibacillus chungkukjangi]HCG4536039.1 Flp pilus assembly complex ATPase component TadA [Salmonella enterica subsp. enterica serovar Typhi str. AG3]
MNYWVNLSIIFIIIGFVIFIISLLMVQQRKESKNFKSEDNRRNYKLDLLLEFIKKRMTEITTQNLYNENYTEEEFKRHKRRRQELSEALKNCNTGDISSKIYVREYIYDLLLNEYGIDENKVDWTIPYDTPSEMSAREKFETLLHLSIAKNGNNGLAVLIDSFQLNSQKLDGSYSITEEDINKMYKKIVGDRKVPFEDKLRVITQLVYSSYKGFGIIDEIRDMKIDGVMGGVSGSPGRMTGYLSQNEFLERAKAKSDTGLNSAWIMYKGKSIHLDFLSFEHESELRRVITNLYKYGHPGQLSESRPYIINEMYDGSRITVVRPKMSEGWAFFNRKKYDMRALELEELYHQENSELPIKLLKFLMKGNRSLAVTGSQGSGKTTLLMALIKFIRPDLNLRIQETAHELNLRSLYPKRNILSFQETDEVNGQSGLDLQKKTDGDVTILGEVATDPVAAWMIQSSQVASLFTLFTHHAKTFRDLVDALRNSLLKVGIFQNESIAEQQVVGVLEFDTHLHHTRVIERITECVPVVYEDESVSMEAVRNANTRDEKLDVFIDVATTYFRQQTQRKQYVDQNIIEYRNGKYVAVHPISENRQKEIESFLTEEERHEFRDFINENWG